MAPFGKVIKIFCHDPNEGHSVETRIDKKYAPIFDGDLGQILKKKKVPLYLTYIETTSMSKDIYMITLHKLFETLPVGPIASSYQVMKAPIRETPPRPVLVDLEQQQQQQQQNNITWAPSKRVYKRKLQETDTPPSARKRTLTIDIDPEPESVPKTGGAGGAGGGAGGAAAGGGGEGGLLKTALTETVPVHDDRDQVRAELEAIQSLLMDNDEDDLVLSQLVSRENFPGW